MDQPTIDGLNTYCVSYAAAKVGLKVALSGLGADEIFGGYPSFNDIPKLLRYSRFLPIVSESSSFNRGLLSLVSSLGLPAKIAGVLHAREMGSAYLLRRSLHVRGELDLLLDQGWLEQGLKELESELSLAKTIAPLKAAGMSERAQIALLEITWYMRNQLLRDTDWASMAHGLEIRVPFVDITSLERVASAVASTRPPTKRDLAACYARFPEAAANRRKTGFTTPVQQWVADSATQQSGGLRNWAHKVHHLYSRSLAEAA
jgi:asparagine synthase (glutamine-hydrolysing)